MNRRELISQGYISRAEGETPLSRDTISEWVKEFSDWEIDSQDDEPRLVRQYPFPDFITALDFANKVGELAEDVDHHPLITLTWGMVKLEWWTHELGGIHQNDFVMAARSDAAYEERTD